MEKLLIESQERISKVPIGFKRYLHNRINWSNRLIAIKGARGSGKTTLMLQYIKAALPKDHTTLYIPMDHLFFYTSKLIDLVEQFVLNGGKYLFLDEVHKYPNWSRELKLIYDRFDELKIVFTSSSILEIYKGESDLSRRVVSYNLHELSLREFLELESGMIFPSFTFDEIIEGHVAISREISSRIKPLHEKGKYLKYGAYPFFVEGVKEYNNKLKNTLSLVLENDLPAVHPISFIQIYKLKKLLFAISTSVPFKPNILKLSEKIEVTRATLLQFLGYLDKANLIFQLRSANKGVTALNKPEKIYLNNTNLIYTTSLGEANVGNLRETFFLNQLTESNVLHYSQQSDFLVNNEFTFEIGGKGKSQKQIKNVEKGFVVKDDIETGIMNIIPLWLFGFLY